MKNVYGLLILILTSSTLIAQTKIETSKAQFNSIESEKIGQILSSYSLVSLNTDRLNLELKKSPKHYEAVLSISENLKWDLVLEENEIRSPEYKSVESSGNGDTELPLTECNTYKGYVNGDPTQFVRLYIDKEKIVGSIYDRKKGYYFINSVGEMLNTKAHDDRFVIYSLEDVKEKNWECGSEPLSDGVKKARNTARASVTTTCNILEVATDSDFEFTTFWGSSANANAAILQNMNAVDGVYSSTFNVRIMVTFQHTWGGPTDTDPYTTTNSSTFLSQFKDHWNANYSYVKRDWAHLYTNKTLDAGVGGVAYTTQVCNNSTGYGLSRRYAGGLWDRVTAHEIGHGLGADHTTTENCTNAGSIMCFNGGSA